MQGSAHSPSQLRVYPWPLTAPSWGGWTFPQPRTLPPASSPPETLPRDQSWRPPPSVRKSSAESEARGGRSGGLSPSALSGRFMQDSKEWWFLLYLLPVERCSVIRTHHRLSVCSPVGRHWGCLQFLTVIKAAMNILAASSDGRFGGFRPSSSNGGFFWGGGKRRVQRWFLA